MQRFFGILLFCGLLVALPGRVLACGQDSGHSCKKEVAEKTATEKKHAEAAASCASEKKHDCEQGHPGRKCPEQGGCCTGGCSCPCGALAGSHSGFMLTGLPPILPACCAATLRQAFYFAQHMPEEVYRAIWQPPQLGA